MGLHYESRCEINRFDPLPSSPTLPLSLILSLSIYLSLSLSLSRFCLLSFLFSRVISHPISLDHTTGYEWTDDEYVISTGLRAVLSTRTCLPTQTPVFLP